MSDDLLADLMAGFVPACESQPGATPAKAAKAANREHWRGVPGDSVACEGLRKPANPADTEPEPAPDSQTFARLRSGTNTPPREHWRGFSQDSQDSQGIPAAAPSQARSCKGCMHSTRYRTCAEPVAAGLRTEAEGFGIEWPPTEHAATCPAWRARDAS